jgi:hypothetical protein
MYNPNIEEDGGMITVFWSIKSRIVLVVAAIPLAVVLMAITDFVVWKIGIQGNLWDNVPLLFVLWLIILLLTMLFFSSRRV